MREKIATGRHPKSRRTTKKELRRDFPPFFVPFSFVLCNYMTSAAAAAEEEEEEKEHLSFSLLVLLWVRRRRCPFYPPPLFHNFTTLDRFLILPFALHTWAWRPRYFVRCICGRAFSPSAHLWSSSFLSSLVPARTAMIMMMTIITSASPPLFPRMDPTDLLHSRLRRGESEISNAAISRRKKVACYLNHTCFSAFRLILVIAQNYLTIFSFFAPGPLFLPPLPNPPRAVAPASVSYPISSPRTNEFPRDRSSSSSDLLLRLICHEKKRGGGGVSSLVGGRRRGSQSEPKTTFPHKKHLRKEGGFFSSSSSLLFVIGYHK